jgi:hypothetical protein
MAAEISCVPHCLRIGERVTDFTRFDTHTINVVI